MQWKYFIGGTCDNYLSYCDESKQAAEDTVTVVGDLINLDGELRLRVWQPKRSKLQNML